MGLRDHVFQIKTTMQLLHYLKFLHFMSRVSIYVYVLRYEPEQNPQPVSDKALLINISRTARCDSFEIDRQKYVEQWRTTLSANSFAEC